VINERTISFTATIGEIRAINEYCWVYMRVIAR
jgi:hypothetical protein